METILQESTNIFNEFYTNQVSFLDYIPNFTIFLDEPEKNKAKSRSYPKRKWKLNKALIEKEKPVPEALHYLNEYVFDFKETVNLYEQDTLKNDFNTKK